MAAARVVLGRRSDGNSHSLIKSCFFSPFPTAEKRGSRSLSALCGRLALPGDCILLSSAILSLSRERELLPWFICKNLTLSKCDLNDAAAFFSPLSYTVPTTANGLVLAPKILVLSSPHALAIFSCSFFSFQYFYLTLYEGNDV